ncbi:MAG: nitroreductase family protein [Eubacteriales bacterium]
MKNRDIDKDFFKGEAKLAKEFADMYQASFLRYSTRKYSDARINERDKERIDTLAQMINEFEDGLTILPVYDAAPDMFQSFIYTKLSKVPGFLAVLIDKSKYADVKSGFYGEAMCLALTNMGISTCWVSGSIKKQCVKDYIDIKPGEKFITSIAFGYDKQLSEEDVASKRKRKPIEKIFKGEIRDENSAKIMACVQNAPSAINRQPWHYGLKEGELYVEKPKIPGGPYPEALDIGISMLHVSCAAFALGKKGTWQFSDDALGVFKSI